MPVIQDFLAPRPDLGALSRWLDAQSPAARAAAVLSLSPRQQAALFEAAQGFRSLRLEHFVPSAAGPSTTVIHRGRNSLPVFSRFEKRFLKPAAQAVALWGYNEGAARPLLGPGYFLAVPQGTDEVLVDYSQLPPTAPAGWPAIQPNSAGLSRFVFHHLSDTLRGVSEHVSIGRAARKGRPMDSWFVLVRA